QALRRIPPENLDVLRTLRAAGIKLGLISNADVMEAAPWPDCPMAHLFDAAIFSCDAGAVKPEAAIYALCIERLGIAAHECLFVGDGGSNELQGANDAGFVTVFVSGVMKEFWPERIPERISIARYHVRTIPELLLLRDFPLKAP